jgi:hypothetical protein
VLLLLSSCSGTRKPTTFSWWRCWFSSEHIRSREWRRYTKRFDCVFFSRFGTNEQTYVKLHIFFLWLLHVRRFSRSQWVFLQIRIEMTKAGEGMNSVRVENLLLTNKFSPWSESETREDSWEDVGNIVWCNRDWVWFSFAHKLFQEIRRTVPKIWTRVRGTPTKRKAKDAETKVNEFLRMLLAGDILRSRR